MPSNVLKYFAFDHLPLHLHAVSKPLGILAQQLEASLPDGPEKSAGMRKLLEAKDCFVRAALDKPRAPGAPSDAELLRALLDAFCTKEGNVVSSAYADANPPKEKPTEPASEQWMLSLARHMIESHQAVQHTENPDHDSDDVKA